MMERDPQFSGKIDRVLPALLGLFLVTMAVFSSVMGGMNIAVIALMLSVAAFGFAVQLEYECKYGILSKYRKT